MCDNCTKRGLVALEAIANGEEIPEPPDEEAEITQIPVCLPFPVMVAITQNGNVGIITTDDGWSAIQNFLKSIGHHPGECGHDHHH